MTTNDATTCVDYVCKYHKVPSSPTQVPNNIQDIIDRLKCHDFFACDIRTNSKGLMDCPKPLIIQTTTGFVVVVKSNAAGVTIIDPTDSALRHIAFPEFVKLWTGLVIVIEPPPTVKKSLLERIFGQPRT